MDRNEVDALDRADAAPERIAQPGLVGAEYRLCGIPANFVDFCWPQAEPYIKQALDHGNGELLSDDLKMLCLDRDVQLWLVLRNCFVIAAATTEIVTYPRKKHCRIITLAGSDFDQWMPMADELIMAWAREQGCAALESINRRGFIPKLEKLGYHFRQAHMLKPLQPGPAPDGTVPLREGEKL